MKDAIENNILSATDLPYFEGDFWPNVLEDSIKELEQEEEEKRKREEAEAAAAEAEATVTTTEGDEVSAVVRFSALEYASANFIILYTIVLCLYIFDIVFPFVCVIEYEPWIDARNPDLCISNQVGHKLSQGSGLA